MTARELTFVLTGTADAERTETKAQLEAFLAPYDPMVQAIVWKTRGLVLQVAPNALEQVDHSARLIAYGWRRTYKDTICVIMPLKSAVNLGFPRGVDLPDPTGLLSGTGKRARHVKITVIQEVEAPALRGLLEAAIEQLAQASAAKPPGHL
jgi:hypothetical protein